VALSEARKYLINLLKKKKDMNKHHHTKNIIERKLDQLPAADIIFYGMICISILDKKRPQKKKGVVYTMFLSSERAF
jgi:hypothetical protein